MKPGQPYDYLIVGAGAAGCVLANRLAASGEHSVALIEAGSASPKRVPLLSLINGMRHAWIFKTTQQPSLHYRQVVIPMGRLLGGSAAINAMIYVRGDRRCFDEWASLGNGDWGFASVLPYFKKTENFEDGESEYHGTGGAIDVSTLRCLAPFSQAFVEAAVEYGMARCADFNGPELGGAGYYHVTQHNGARVGAQTLLTNLGVGKNLAVVPGALVHRVLFEKRRAVGVELLKDGKTQRILASREVILSAGAINSPKVLMLSGIGAADHLRRHDIDVVADVPGVGQGLQDHPRIPVLFRYNGPPLPHAIVQPKDLLRTLWAYGNWASRGGGPLTSNLCEAGAFVHANGGGGSADLQFTTHWSEQTVDFEPSVVAPTSRGSVTLRSADPRVPPAVDPRYLATEHDVSVLTRGLAISRELVRMTPMRSLRLSEEIMPGDDIQAPSEIEHYVRTSVRSCSHPAGSCKMTPSLDPLGVVDERLAVRGVERLRVIDASIMPSIVNSNPCAATVMIAERGAEFVRAASGA